MIAIERGLKKRSRSVRNWDWFRNFQGGETGPRSGYVFPNGMRSRLARSTVMIGAFACDLTRHDDSSASPTRRLQGRLAHLRGPRAHALVHGDLLSAAAADRQGARPLIHRDRAHHDDPARRRRDLE